MLESLKSPRLRRWWWAGAAAIAVVGVPGVWWWRGRARPLRVERVVTNLSAQFDRSAVASEATETPVRVGGLQPGGSLSLGGRYRQAIVAPPPATIRFRTHVPGGATLRFGTAVEGTGKRDTARAGVRFAVQVDGRDVFARAENPARSREDRRWFDDGVPVGGGERDVEITLTTEQDGKGTLAGTPGWSHVRIVREHQVDRQRATRERPNVVVLLVDTLRADRLGCYGATPSPSPHLDALAAGGTLFERAIAQSSWTLPSVASLFTGLYPRSHGVVGRDSRQDGREDPAYLSDALPTFAEAAEATGVTTIGVSGSVLVSSATNFARGFETFVEFGWDTARKNWRPAADVDDAFLDWAYDHGGDRFLAYLHYMDPHDPYTPPPATRPALPPGMRTAVAAGDVEHLAQRLEGGGSVPRLEAAEVDYLRALYDGEIRAWDLELGRLLERLEALDLRDSTVLVVTADHGEEFDEHGRLKHGAHLFDETVHVPLVIAGPGVRAARVPAQVEGVDLFPTLSALLGFPVPDGLPGRNVLGPLDARPAFSETRFGAMGEGATEVLESVRTTEWKLIHAPASGRYLLYDLVHDPGEREDRYGQARDAGTLAAALTYWEAATPGPPPVTGHDAQMEDRLRALGYVD